MARHQECILLNTEKDFDNIIRESASSFKWLQFQEKV